MKKWLCVYLGDNNLWTVYCSAETEIDAAGTFKLWLYDEYGLCICDEDAIIIDTENIETVC